MLRLFLVALLFSLLTACASVSSGYRPDSYYQPAASSGGLFDESNSSLADQEIARLINYRVKVPPSMRIAVLDLSTNGQSFSAFVDTFIKQNFFDKLAGSPYIYDASYLPPILIPRQTDIQQLREAAARYQADWLLVYRSQCRSFHDYNVLAKDKSKAWCSVEAAMLDTRSGVIPFTMVSSKALTVSENSRDTNFYETTQKNEQNAINQALSEIADRLLSFVVHLHQGESKAS